MDARQLIVLALQVSIIGTVFSFGLNTTHADFRYLFGRPGLLFRSLLAVLVITPLMAIVLVQVFEFQRAAEIALVALAISPLPPLLPSKESKVVGNTSYGVALMALLALLAIVTVPLSVKVLEQVVGRPLNVPTAAIARMVSVAVLLPLLVGMAVRTLRPAVAERIEPVITLVAKILLILGAVALFAGMWRAILGAIGGGAVAAMLVFVVLALAIGDLLGQPEREHSIVLALSAASHHPAIALSIASANAPNEHFAGTILLYLLVNLVVGGLYIAWQHRSARSSIVST
jgi:BASS family bile acid:Na+ symporter